MENTETKKLIEFARKKLLEPSLTTKKEINSYNKLNYELERIKSLFVTAQSSQEKRAAHEVLTRVVRQIMRRARVSATKDQIIRAPKIEIEPLTYLYNKGVVLSKKEKQAIGKACAFFEQFAKANKIKIKEEFEVVAEFFLANNKLKKRIFVFIPLRNNFGLAQMEMLKKFDMDQFSGITFISRPISTKVNDLLGYYDLGVKEFPVIKTVLTATDNAFGYIYSKAPSVVSPKSYKNFRDEVAGISK